MELLYHYSNNQKGFCILKEKTIRLNDIRKSNDYNELVLFYPEILDEIFQVYRESPFELKHKDKNGEEALISLLDINKTILTNNIISGDFSNFVLCLSEKADMLSQWRGYANDGQGISIGFSKDGLKEISEDNDKVFRLEKVEYINEEKYKTKINEYAISILEEIKYLRKWIVENMTHDDSSLDTDTILSFNVYYLIKDALTDSLRYKQQGFEEENEWRLFLKDQAYKNPDWVLGENDNYVGPNGFYETVSFLNNSILFDIADNNILPYVPLDFSGREDYLVKEIWLGPKSHIAQKDIKLLLAQYGYNNTEVFFSKTSYR